MWLLLCSNWCCSSGVTRVPVGGWEAAAAASAAWESISNRRRWERETPEVPDRTSRALLSAVTRSETEILLQLAAFGTGARERVGKELIWAGFVLRACLTSSKVKYVVSGSCFVLNLWETSIASLGFSETSYWKRFVLQTRATGCKLCLTGWKLWSSSSSCATDAVSSLWSVK